MVKGRRQIIIVVNVSVSGQWVEMDDLNNGGTSKLSGDVTPVRDLRTIRPKISFCVLPVK